MQAENPSFSVCLAEGPQVAEGPLAAAVLSCRFTGVLWHTEAYVNTSLERPGLQAAPLKRDEAQQICISGVLGASLL